MKAEELQTIAFEIILKSGDGRTHVHEAFESMRAGKFEEASEKLDESKDKLVQAHKAQNKLLQEYANGEKVEVDILMVHAQDHLMTTMTIKEIALEMMEMYKELDKLKTDNENLR